MLARKNKRRTASAESVYPLWHLTLQGSANNIMSGGFTVTAGASRGMVSFSVNKKSARGLLAAMLGMQNVHSEEDLLEYFVGRLHVPELKVLDFISRNLERLSKRYNGDEHKMLRNMYVSMVGDEVIGRNVPPEEFMWFDISEKFIRSDEPAVTVLSYLDISALPSSSGMTYRQQREYSENHKTDPFPLAMTTGEGLTEAEWKTGNQRILDLIEPTSILHDPRDI